jgi:hypothetical protein
VTVQQNDPVTGLYRTLLVFAGIGLVILTAGLIEFLHFEPVNVSGLHAHITGVYSYDPSTHQTSGPNRQTFARAEDFAAVVDWSGLPDTITARAIWIDSFENVVGSAGPDKPSALGGQTTIPAAVPHDLKFHLPGEYIFAIERVVNGQPVEVLARRIIEVQRS